MTLELDATGPGTGSWASTAYTVTVDAGAAFVYYILREAKHPTPYWAATDMVPLSWLQYGTDATTEVAITRVAGSITSYNVYPPEDATAVLAGGVLTLTLATNTRVWVDMNGDLTHPLLVFASPLKSALPSPRTDYTTLTKTATLTTGGSGTVTSAAHGYIVGDVVTLHAATTMPTATTGDLTAYEQLTVLTVPTANTLTLEDAADVAVTFTDIGTGTITLHPAEWTNTGSALYFPAGEHKGARLFNLASDTSVYFDEASVTVGSWDLRSTDGITFRGPGLLSGIYATPAFVDSLVTFEARMAYSMFYGEDNLQYFWTNSIEGPTCVAPCGWFNRGGLSSWRNTHFLNPWWWGIYGIYPAGYSTSNKVATVDDSFVYNGDDAVGYAHESRDVIITNVFSVTTLGSCFQNRYWPLAADAGYTADITDCHAMHTGRPDSGLDLVAPPPGSNTILMSLLDGDDTPAEDTWGDYNTTVTNLKVHGPLVSSLFTFGNLAYPFSAGSRKDQHGQLANMRIDGLTVDSTPGQLARIIGLDGSNTPHDIAFTGFTIAGVDVNEANHATYVTVDAEVYNLTWGDVDIAASMTATATLSSLLSRAYQTNPPVVSTPDHVTFMKQRIHNTLNAAIVTGEFFKCRVDHRDGSMSIDPDNPIHPTSIAIRETRASFRDALRYRRGSGSGEIQSWSWIARVEFNCEVACEAFETALLDTGIKIPPIVGLSPQRALLARLVDSDYTHPPEQSPSRGTVVDFIFEIVPETLRK